VESAFSKHFYKIKENVDDIRLLSKGRLTPLVNQVSYHLNCLENDLVLEKTPEIYLGIERFVENGLRNLARKFLTSAPEFKQFNFSRTPEHLSVKQWERVLEVFPTMLKLALLVHAKETIDLNIGQKFVTLKLIVRKDELIKVDRVDVYKSYRKLFDSQVLATFTLEDLDATCDRLILKFDISHREDILYQINLDYKSEKFILMSNILENYILPKDFTFNEREHNLIFKLADDFTLNRIENDSSNLQISDTEMVLSFCFLFRHIYLIIPMKGTLIGSAFRKDVINTHFINLFSLLSN
jgi:hypothetical protein